MPVVEVSCPTCHTKFKAPEDAVGKKARCKKCGNKFRIPGGAAAAPALDLPDEEEIAMAEAVDEPLPAPPAPPASPPPAPAPTPVAASVPAPKPAPAPSPPPAAKPTPAPPPPPASRPAPAKDLSELPSADPFDFGPPTPAKTAKPTPKPAAAAPAKATPAPTSAAKASPTPATAPAAKAAPTPAPAPAKPAGKAEPLPLEPLPLDPEPAKLKADKPKGEESPKAKKKERNEDEPPAKKKGKREADKDVKPPEDESYNPFADFEPGPGEGAPLANPWDDEPKPKKKPKKGDAEEEEVEEPEKPRYRRPQEKGGLGLAIVVTAVIGLFALGLGVVAVVVFIKQNRKEPEQVKEEKKEEPPPAFPDGAGAPAGGQAGEPEAKEPEPKAKEKEPDAKAKEPEKAPGMTRPAAHVARPKAFTVGAMPAKTELADKADKEVVLESPVAGVKRVFPPADPKTGDTAVLVQTAAGAGGMGEKLALDIYGPAGNRVASERIEYDGDGLANPIADFTVSKDLKAYFLAATGGKLHVWAVTDKRKVADGVSPYAEKPEHAKSGLAAAFFTADPNRVVLVSTAGAVLLYDLKTKKPLKDFIPPNGVAGRVSLGHSAAKVEGGNSVVVAVGGVLYQIQADATLAVLQQHDLGGDVYRSLGLAVVGTPGRIVYAFEGLADGKKEPLVLGFPAGAGAKPVAYRFPAPAAGEPKGALWAGGDFAGVATDRGVLWFDGSEKKFAPMLFAQPPGAAHYFGDEKSFWYVIPHPKEEGKSALVALSMPFEGFMSFGKNFASSQPLRAVKIDAKGLSK